MAEPDAFDRPGRLVEVVAAQLYVVEVGEPGAYPIVVGAATGNALSLMQRTKS